MAAVLGHINCPSCGAVSGMRITHDKNGEPFGYCEATCSQQLRIGGDANRVALFIKRYPWAAKNQPPPPVTDTEQNQPSEPVAVEKKPVKNWQEIMGVSGL